MTGDRDFIAQVMSGKDFARAVALFEHLPYTQRVLQMPSAPAGWSLERRADRVDHFLSWVGLEGIKGAWKVSFSNTALAVGFDEWIVLAPFLTEIQRSVLTDAGLIDE